MRWHAVSVSAFGRTELIPRAPSHHALCSVEYGEIFPSLPALQKANLLCTASTKDAHSVITLGHAATNGHSA